MKKIASLPPKDTSFGHAMLPYFPLDPNYKMVNSGALGVTPNYVIAAQKAYYREVENNPDLSYRITHKKYLDERRELVAKRMNAASHSDIVMIENATEGVNSVLKSLKYSEGDVILVYDTMFHMVEDVAKYLCDRFKAEMVVIPTSQEALNSSDKLVNLAEEYIQKYGQRIKIAVVDHIVSFPSVIFPVKELVQLFRKNDILCLVDAAHALGQVEIDLQSLDPDFYVVNLHKWAFCAKTASALYVKKDFHGVIFPVMTSHIYKASLEEDFKFLGTRDYSAIYSSKEAFEFIDNLGEEKIKAHNHSLALIVGKEISRVWNTEELVSNQNMIGAMTTILLPFQGKEIGSLGEEFCEKYNTFIKIGLYQGKYYARFSAQIFNELEDYVYVANAFLEVFPLKRS